MNLTQFLEQTAEAARNSNPPQNGDYYGSDGLLYCGKCHTQKEVRLERWGNIIRPAMCECAERQYNDELQQREREKLRELARELRRKGLTDTAYFDYCFSNDDKSRPEITRKCKAYAENFAQMYEQNKGLIFMGGVGTGKTFFACCIANDLMDKGRSAWVTTMQPLLRAASSFNTADQIFERLKAVDLLVLDDFGTTGSKYSDQLFEIIDTRYRAKKPLIITTNLDSKDLNTTNVPLDKQRIFDRVRAMCAGKSEKGKIVVDGETRRK